MSFNSFGWQFILDSSEIIWIWVSIAAKIEHFHLYLQSWAYLNSFVVKILNIVGIDGQTGALGDKCNNNKCTSTWIVSLPCWSSVCWGFVMHIIPRDCVVPVRAGWLTNSEDESLVKSLPQQHQNLSALRGVREKGPTWHTRIWLTRIRMLLLHKTIWSINWHQFGMFECF